MFNKVEFSDLYKFLTSIGLMIMASSFIIPWLFMTSEMGLLIPEKDYNALIENSKVLANQKIELNLLIIKTIPYVSIVLFFIGTIICAIGLRNWKKKQNYVDETDQLNLTDLRAKINELNSDEIDRKAELEVKQELQTQNKNQDTNARETIEALKSKLLGMEKLFYDKIVEHNSFNYSLKSNLKLDNKYEIDIALLPVNKKHKPIFIDIKYLQKKLMLSIVQEGLQKLLEIQTYYFNTTRRIATLELIIVYNSKITSKDEIDRFKLGIKNYISQFKPVHFKYYILDEEEARNFKIKSIIN